MTDPAAIERLGPLLVFDLGTAASPRDEVTFGIALGDLLQVIEPARISPVPLAPSTILGIMNYRGRIVTLVDPAPLLGLAPQGTPPGQVVVLRPRQKTMATIGLQITRAREVVTATAVRDLTLVSKPGILAVVHTDNRRVQLLSTDAIIDTLTERVIARGTVELRQGVSL